MILKYLESVDPSLKPPLDSVCELGLGPGQEEPQVDGESGHVHREGPTRVPVRVPTHNLLAVGGNLSGKWRHQFGANMSFIKRTLV